jgi:TetR/AcrR family transcriptional repressor of mexJK operon
VLSDEKIAVYRLITAETARFPELGRAFYRSGPEKGKQFMAEYFDRAVDDGKLKPGDPMTMAIHFFDLCKGELHQRKLWNVTDHITDDEIAQSAARSIDVFLSAYGA